MMCGAASVQLLLDIFYSNTELFNFLHLLHPKHFSCSCYKTAFSSHTLISIHFLTLLWENL